MPTCWVTPIVFSPTRPQTSRSPRLRSRSLRARGSAAAVGCPGRLPTAGGGTHLNGRSLTVTLMLSAEPAEPELAAEASSSCAGLAGELAGGASCCWRGVDGWAAGLNIESARGLIPRRADRGVAGPLPGLAMLARRF